MIKIKIIAVGKIKAQYHQSEIEEYLKRLDRYADIDIEEVEEFKTPQHPNDKEILKTNDEEAKRLVKKIQDRDFVIVLDVHGKILSSEEFAATMGNLVARGSSRIVFVIGGSYGLGKDIIERSDLRLSLSKLTFTHQMTRVIILEQIYRAFKIIGNEEYHK